MCVCVIALSVFMRVSAHVNPSERVRARECVHACVTMPDGVYVHLCGVLLWWCGCVCVVLLGVVRWWCVCACACACVSLTGLDQAEGLLLLVLWMSVLW